ncbi:hypothetical protein Taro_014348, partial [Colocasia esculenta]|nr:hypothetical protein [Colocasia esculenta]
LKEVSFVALSIFGPRVLACSRSPQKAPNKLEEAMEPAQAPKAVDPKKRDSSDEEIDYSTKPEFYDSDLDEKDEKWVQAKRKGCTSDALLSCPACFTTLCLDCQRHENYVTQYRAMFALNCEVKSNQILKEEKRKPKRSRKYKTSEENLENGKDEVIFHPVCCAVCSTEVGVFDENEVYHFFNVLPSYT